MAEVVGVVEARNDSGVKVNGRWYDFSQYSKADFSKIQKGRTYKLVVVNDKYIKNFEEVSGENTETTQAETNVWEEKDRRISRMNSITNAIQLLIHNKPDDVIRLEEVIALADKFMEYIYTGKVTPPKGKRKESKSKNEENGEG